MDVIIICDVAKRKYGSENWTAENYLDFGIKNDLITPINSRSKISYCLVTIPDINVDGKDSLTSAMVENPQLVIPGSGTSNSYLNQGGRRQSSKFSERDSLINCNNGEKTSNELSFELDQGMNVNLDLKENIDTKNVLSFYIQKIILL